jgi:hypothetical protein
MKYIKIRVRYIEELLGTASADPNIHRRFIASKGPNAETIEEEVAALGADAVSDRAMTVFPRMEDGTPFIWDYQWKGYFKESCKMLKNADATIFDSTGKKQDNQSKKIKAYRRDIDGLVFVQPRKIALWLPMDSDVSDCQRPLRASTPQGERVSLADSETVPEGTQQEFTVTILRDDLLKPVLEWLDYGRLHGTGQWRNSGKGRFVYTAYDSDGNVIRSNEETA